MTEQDHRGRLATLAIGLLVVGSTGPALGSIYPYRQPVLHALLDSIYALCMDAGMIWAAMQGSGRMRQTLSGLGYVSVLAVVGILVSQYPYGIRPEVLLEIDLPTTFLDLMSMVSLLKMASLLTGIEIIDRVDQGTVPKSGWTIARWMWLLIAIAVFVQTSMVRARWYSEYTSIFPGDLATDGFKRSYSLASVPNVFAVFLITQLSQSTVSLLLAGWVFSGRRWRLWLIPVVGLLVYAVKLLCVHLSFNVLDSGALLNILPLMSLDMALNETSGLLPAVAWLTSLGHITLAWLVVWVGCRWDNRQLQP